MNYPDNFNGAACDAAQGDPMDDATADRLAVALRIKRLAGELDDAIAAMQPLGERDYSLFAEDSGTPADIVSLAREYIDCEADVAELLMRRRAERARYRNAKFGARIVVRDLTEDA